MQRAFYLLLTKIQYLKRERVTLSSSHLYPTTIYSLASITWGEELTLSRAPLRSLIDGFL